MIKYLIKDIEGLILPQRAYSEDAGYDIVAASELHVIGVAYEKSSNLWNRIDYIEYETNLYIQPQNYGMYIDNFNFLNKKYHTLIFPRSSISKYNLTLKNSIGLIDFGYQGQILCRFNYIFQPEDLTVTLDKDGQSLILGKINKEKIYKQNDKIAQLVCQETNYINFEKVKEFSKTQRGKNGFGSTTK